MSLSIVSVVAHKDFSKYRDLYHLGIFRYLISAHLSGRVAAGNLRSSIADDDREHLERVSFVAEAAKLGGASGV